MNSENQVVTVEKKLSELKTSVTFLTIRKQFLNRKGQLLVSILTGPNSKRILFSQIAEVALQVSWKFIIHLHFERIQLGLIMSKRHEVGIVR